MRWWLDGRQLAKMDFKVGEYQRARQDETRKQSADLRTYLVTGSPVDSANPSCQQTFRLLAALPPLMQHPKSGSELEQRR